jgi:GTP diphosphokinase / guanosine-3',5'-bis(diphosphate) 3'-diphosphatase
MESSRRVYFDAVGLAYNAHLGQVDKGGNMYFLHPARVARYVGESGGSYEAMTIAILHDVLEDTDISLSDLYSRLGISDHVAEGLLLLTRPEEETYADFIDRIANSGNMDAVLVKLCDLKDNLDPSRALPESEKSSRLKARYLKAKKVLENVYFS